MAETEVIAEAEVIAAAEVIAEADIEADIEADAEVEFHDDSDDETHTTINVFNGEVENRRRPW